VVQHAEAGDQVHRRVGQTDVAGGRGQQVVHRYATNVLHGELAAGVQQGDGLAARGHWQQFVAVAAAKTQGVAEDAARLQQVESVQPVQRFITVTVSGVVGVHQAGVAVLLVRKPGVDLVLRKVVAIQRRAGKETLLETR
jgi:hypothetical protein